MPDQESPGSLVGEVHAGSVVVAGYVGVINLPGAAEDVDEVELRVNRRSLQQHRHSEALEGFRELLRSAEQRGSLTPQKRFRIANNMGVCLLGLGRPQEAEVELRRALALQPHEGKANVNLGAALCAQGRREEAIGPLRVAIGDVEMRGKAAGLLVSVLADLGRGDEVASFLEAEAWAEHAAPVQLALARQAFRTGDLDAARRRAQLPLATDDTAVEAAQLLALVALRPAAPIEGADTVVLPISDETSPDQLDEGIRHLNFALDRIPEALAVLRAETLTNRALLHLYRGALGLAEADFREALRLAPTRHPHTVVNFAALLLKSGREIEAIGVLKEALRANDDIDLHLQLAAALMRAGSWQAAESELATRWQLVEDDGQRLQAAEMLFDASLRAGHEPVADGVLAAIAAQSPESSAAWSFLGHGYARRDSPAQAVHAFRMAVSLTRNEAQHQARQDLAVMLAIGGDHAGAVAELSDVPVDRLSERGGEALVVSLFNLGQYAKCAEACGVLVDSHRASVRTTHVAIEVASKAGDTERALSLSNAAIGQRGATLHDRCQRAYLYLRQGQESEATAELTEGWAVAAAASAREWMIFANLLSACGSPRSIEAAFRAWERGRTEPEVQGWYPMFALKRAHRSAIPNPAVMAAGTAIRVADQRGGERRYSVLEDGDTPVDPATWLHASDVLAQRLLGKKAGDRIVWKDDGIQRIEFEVLEVQSKYVRAIQETMLGFNETFPDAQGLWRFDVPKDDPHAVLELIAKTQGNQAHIDNLLARYAAGQLPLASVGKILHKSFPVAWAATINHDHGNVRFNGPPGPWTAAEDQIRASGNPGDGPVMLDYSALVTWCALEEEHRQVLQGLVDRPRVVQVLVDDLWQHKMQAAKMGDSDGMSISFRDGQFWRSEIGDEEGFLSRHLEFLRGACDAVPSYGAFAVDATLFGHMVELLGEPTAHTIGEVHARGGILVVDDHALRVMSWQEFRLPTITTLGLAHVAVRRGLLTLDGLAAIVERLALAKYRFISLSPDLAVQVIRRQNWDATAQAVAVFKCLEGPECTAESAAGVGAHVLKELALEPASVLHQDAAVTALLQALFTGRDVRQMAILLDVAIAAKMWLLPVQLDRMREHVRAHLAARNPR